MSPEEILVLLESTANMLRGMTLDPAIPKHAKEAMAHRISELDHAALATQSTQAEAPSEREDACALLRELVEAYADHRDAQGAWGNGNPEQILKTESRLIKALAGARAALATLPEST